MIKLRKLKWRCRVDFQQVPMWQGPGGQYYYKLEYEVVARFDMATAHFEIECQGHVVGRESIDVELDTLEA